MAVASAMVGAAVAVNLLLGRPFLVALATSLLSSAGTLVIFFTLSFLWALWKAPGVVRKDLACPPGVAAQIKGTVTIRDTDVMQRHASDIVGKIQRVREMEEARAKKAPSAYVDAVYKAISTLEERAQYEPWIPARSRVRARRLAERLRGLQDFDEIERLCRDFTSLRPIH